MAASVTKITEYTASLLNSSKWIVVEDGVTNGTTTLTSATAAFASSDKGKTISITGAGVAGVTLLTTIVSVTNATTIIMADTATSTATAHTVSFGGRSYDPRHTEPVIQEAVLQKDLVVCTEILNDPNHPQRGNFTPFAPAIVANGAQLPPHTGALNLVEIQFTTGSTWRVGMDAPFHKILRWSRNFGSQLVTSNLYEGVFAVNNDQLFYTGVSARVTGVLLAKTTACQAPVEYASKIALLAAADLFATEGDDLQATQLLSQAGMAIPTSIRQAT